MEQPALGAKMHSAGIVLHGTMQPDEWLTFLREVTAAIGMEAVGEPAIWTYPVGGKGGSGSTYFLPITESFIALDTWQDHNGAYLFVCSCRPYFTADIDKVAVKFGLKVTLRPSKRFYAELGLAPVSGPLHRP